MSRSSLQSDPVPSSTSFNRSPDAPTYRRRSRSRSPPSDASISTRSPSPSYRRVSSRPTSPSPMSENLPPRGAKVALRIDHLTQNVRESHLHHIFNWYGHVDRVHLRPSREEREGWAYVVMSSVGEAAKAALYMDGGQIDGARFSVSTCEMPREEELPVRSREVGGWERERRSSHSGRDARDYGRGDRRREREGGRDEGGSRGVHPDRQRMIGGDRYTNGNRCEERYAIPTRKWGQPQPSQSRSSRDRSSSPSRDRRHSDAAQRRSPSY